MGKSNAISGLTDFSTFVFVKKRIVISVSNDLATDQRVRKQCAELHEAGYEIWLLGRKLPNSMNVDRPYGIRRFNMLFKKGAFFYAFLNIRLFFKLLFAKADVFWANDLDTLPANAFVAKLRNKKLIYDSHEFFTEVPEIQSRPFVKGVWRFFEKASIGKASMVITVNQSIADLLKDTYSIDNVLVVRNVPEKGIAVEQKKKSELGFDEELALLIMQGSGINVDRGGEELVDAMPMIKNASLVFVGGGDALPELKNRVKSLGLTERVRFVPKVPYEEMMEYTSAADIGFTLDKDTNLNYRFSLPNKLFDYVMAETPIIATNLPEVARLVNEKELGLIIEHATPSEIASAVNELLANPERLKVIRANLRRAQSDLSWKSEFEEVLKRLSGLVR